jgi:hypothetical protein
MFGWTKFLCLYMIVVYDLQILKCVFFSGFFNFILVKYFLSHENNVADLLYCILKGADKECSQRFSVK